LRTADALHLAMITRDHCGKCGRQFSPNSLLDGSDDIGEPLAHKEPVGIFERRRNTKRRDDLGKHEVRQDLAVSDHAVEVEYEPPVGHGPPAHQRLKSLSRHDSWTATISGVPAPASMEGRARFAPKDATDDRRNKHLLRFLLCVKGQHIEALRRVETGNCCDDAISPKAILSVGKAFKNWFGQ